MIVTKYIHSNVETNPKIHSNNLTVIIVILAVLGIALWVTYEPPPRGDHLSATCSDLSLITKWTTQSTYQMSGSIVKKMINAQGTTLYLIGTNHILSSCAKDTYQLTMETQPDYALVELCPERTAILRDSSHMIGGDCRGVFKASRQLKRPCILADQLVFTTLHDIIVNASYRDTSTAQGITAGVQNVWDAFKPSSPIQPYEDENVFGKEDTQDSQNDSRVKNLLGNDSMGADEALMEVLLHSRDVFLSQSILAACTLPMEKNVIVAQVGMAHIDGIEKYLLNYNSSYGKRLTKEYQQLWDLDLHSVRFREVSHELYYVQNKPRKNPQKLLAIRERVRRDLEAAVNEESRIALRKQIENIDIILNDMRGDFD